MTELIWDGKYKDGKKQGPVRIALPFQTIETVNESTRIGGGILNFLPAVVTGMAKPAHLGRQEICSAITPARTVRQGQPNLYRPAFQYRGRFFFYGGDP